MTTYEISDGESTETIEADDMDDARKQAEEWARDGEWGMDQDGATTIWIDVSIREELTPELLSAVELVESHDDDDIMGAEEIEEAFAAIYDRPSTLDDRNNGLWSLICAGVPDPDNLEEDDITVVIQPPEPDCTDGGDHDWQSPQNLVGGCDESPGVFGHGGSVVIHEVCMVCGTERVTDAWAQRPDTGEQGLESVSYEAGKYEDEVAADGDGE